MVAALAAEVLETLPEHQDSYALIADAEARAHLALGFSDRAFRRYRMLLNRYESLVQSDPGRADFQHGLSVSYERMGDLYRVLGQGEVARQAFASALAIRERLAAAEPDRADFQRDLVVSLVRQAQAADGLAARAHLQRALRIVETLQAEGRLAPADADMLPALRQAFEQASVPPRRRGLAGRMVAFARRLRSSASLP